MEKNLDSAEALAKFKELVNDIRVAMFITNDSEADHTRPMHTIEVDENATVWFFTDLRSTKVEEVSQEKNVHLVYAHPGKESYLDLWGNATVVTDKQLIHDKWSPLVKAWFPKGINDPNIALLKVQPHHAYYWDAETGKMVAFLKIIASAVSGKKFSEGSQGKLVV